jgi:hypothetical protein
VLQRWVAVHQAFGVPAGRQKQVPWLGLKPSVGMTKLEGLDETTFRHFKEI